MWIAISKTGIIGPFWLVDEGISLTVTAGRYLQVLKMFWTGLGHTSEIESKVQWFEQEGTTPHSHARALQLLEDRFENRAISRRGDIQRVPRSPDRYPLDFHLCGYLEGKLIGQNLNGLQALRTAVTNEVKRIPREQHQRGIDFFLFHVQNCVCRRNRHFEHLILTSVYVMCGN